ncbi:hypothetical protein VTJ49DRAFT_2989 [Mycothermus thermophilus]|uniref:alpha-glucosidase n=1 Tax=Humicola insolens TaxID=85995 RepID=A0ABR3V8P5_HUMIN
MAIQGRRHVWVLSWALMKSLSVVLRAAVTAQIMVTAVSAETTTNSHNGQLRFAQEPGHGTRPMGPMAPSFLRQSLTEVVTAAAALAQDYMTYIILGSLLTLALIALSYRRRHPSPEPRAVPSPIPRSRPPLFLLLPAMAVFAFSATLLLAGFQYLRGATPSPPSKTTSSSPSPQPPVYTLPASIDVGQNVLPNIHDPAAVDAQTVCPGYRASNVERTDGEGFTADLDLAGPACNVYGTDVEHLRLIVEVLEGDLVHVEIRPRYLGEGNVTWFVLPEGLVPRPKPKGRMESDYVDDAELAVTWENEPSFWFEVTRRKTGDVLFSTKGSVLVYEDQFVEFVSPLPEEYNLYGLGEVIHGFRLGNNLTRTLFAADVPDTIDANLYGVHPIYLDTRYYVNDTARNKLVYIPWNAAKDAPSQQYVSYTHGVFLRNTHAQEVLLRPKGITWRMLGGSIDLYFYGGPRALDVIQAYQTTTTGLPAMQQYWTLGFHQCRWGYGSWSELRAVVDRFERAGIPLETIWADIDYMKKYRNFENDPENFSYEEGARFLERLRENHQHYVPIVDSAIYAPNPENPDDAYPPYDRGIEADAFMLNPDGSVYYGAVWPGYTVFPDWIGAALNGTGAVDWWVHELKRWYEKIQFDGLWVDMSEVASFCVGSCGTGKLTQNPVHPPFVLPGDEGKEPDNLPLFQRDSEDLEQDDNTPSLQCDLEGLEQTNLLYDDLNNLLFFQRSFDHFQKINAAERSPTTTPTPMSSAPYHRTTPTPGARNVNYPPYVINNYHGDLSVHAISPNATHHGGTLDYDFHSLFGHQILRATYRALRSIFPTKRPFLLGRSTFAGSGRYAAHWGGDNHSKWPWMYFSIPQALSFSIFGVPMFGVDVCGFAGDVSEELCSRWMQLAAFFPFYRNHNIRGARPQEPYAWPAVAEATRRAMRVRYAMLPYVYTLMAKANLRGDPVVRALAWEFPDEPWLADADRQFMLGSAALVTPCLEEGAEMVRGVFPGSDAPNKVNATVWYDWYTGAATSKELVQQRGQNVTIPAPLGGDIPVFVRGGSVVAMQESRMTTAESRRTPWGLVVALDGPGKAEGELYLDDGESFAPGETTWVRFEADKTFLRAVPEGNYLDGNALSNVTVMGLGKSPVRIWLDSRELELANWKYDQDRQVLRVFGLDGLFPDGGWAKGWVMNWE